jgi:hypothetical protein
MIARPLSKFRSVNSSSSGFAAPVCEFDLSVSDAATAAGRALQRLSGGPGGKVPCAIELWPYGLGSDNDVFSMRLLGWKRLFPLGSTGRQFWVPSLIATLSCTLSAFVGLASGPVIETERFCDTISISFEGTKTADVTRTGSVLLYSPANDTPGRAVVKVEGFEAIELQFDQTTGTPTMNSLFSLLSKD